MARARRIAKWVGIALGTLLVLLIGAIVVASRVYQGERLGALATNTIVPKLGMAGTIRVRGIDWSLGAIPAVFTHARTPLVLTGVSILDPEGRLVLEAERITADLEVHLSPLEILIHDLRTGKSMWTFGAMKKHEGIGFLAALAPVESPADKEKRLREAEERKKKGLPAPAGPSFLFAIASAPLDGLTAIFDFNAWGLELRDIKAAANLTLDNLSPQPKLQFFGFDAQDLDARGGGYLRILDGDMANVLPFDRVAVRQVATLRDRPNDIKLDLTAARTGRSTLRTPVKPAYFTGIYGLAGDDDKAGIDAHVEFVEAADALAAVAAGKKIDGLSVSGQGTHVVADLTQTFDALQVDARFDRLDAGFQDMKALGINFRLRLDMGKQKLDLEKFAFAAPGGGRFGLDLGFDLAKNALAADLRFDRFTATSYLPKPLRSLLGGHLDGKLHAALDLDPAPKGRLAGLDLTFLPSSKRSPLPRRVHLRGSAHTGPNFDPLDTDGLTVDIPGAEAKAHGHVELARQVLDVGLQVVVSDLAGLLAGKGLPPDVLARRATLSIDATGKLDNPDAKGQADVLGVEAQGHAIPDVRTRFSLGKGRANLEDLSMDALGGHVQIKGTATLWKGSTAHMLRKPVITASVRATDIDLFEALGSDMVRGRVTLEVDAEGPIDKLAARVHVPGGAVLQILGEPYTLGEIAGEMHGRDVTLRTLHVARGPGGTLDVHGKATLGGPLSIDLALGAVPLRGLPILQKALDDAGVALDGTVAANLHIEGTPAAPVLSGQILLAGVEARGVELGDARIDLAALAGGGVAITGDLFKRFKVDGRVALGPKGPDVALTLAFQDLVIESLLPELAQLNEGHALVSGKVAVVLPAGGVLGADVRLTKIEGSAAQEIVGPDDTTTVERLGVHNAGDLHLAFAARPDGPAVTLDPFTLVTDHGQVKIAGRLTRGEVEASVDGHVDLELALPFLRARVDDLAGDVDAHVEASGTLASPVIRGTIGVTKPIKIALVGLDDVIWIPSGTVAIEPAAVHLDRLAIKVDDATMTVAGAVAFPAPLVRSLTASPPLGPRQMELSIGGEISAHLLEAAAPGVLSDTAGRAAISARVTGTPAAPELAAHLELGHIDFHLRSPSHDVRIDSGAVDVSNRGIVLHGIRMAIDEEGLLVVGGEGVADGRVAFDDFRKLVAGEPGGLGRFDLPLHGERIAYRIPGVLAIDDLAFDLNLGGDLDEGLDLSGDVRLVSGRYVQDVLIKDLVISPRINEASVRPFYAGQPLLENTTLDLRVRTVGDGFLVQNNLAPEILLAANLIVRGTVAAPAISGDIRPTDGRLHIPPFRGDFTLTPNAGFITFVEGKKVGKDTPEVGIDASSTAPDSNGVEHNVRLHISGPISQLQMDLSTDDGLDRGQTMMLLITGRTTDDLQRFNTASPTVGANVSTATSVAGQMSRDLTANLLEPYISDTFSHILGFDLRPAVGPDGVQLAGVKNISRYLNLQGDVLIGFQNQRSYKAKLSLWTSDFVTLNLLAQQLTLSTQPTIVETTSSGNLELTWEYPLRF